MQTAIPVAISIAAVWTILFEAIPKQLLKIFSASEVALTIGVPGLRIIAITFILGAVTTVLGYTCSGLGNGLVNMISTALRQFIPLVPLAYLFGKMGGIGVIWYAMWISELLAVLFAVFYTRREFEKKVSLLNEENARGELIRARLVPH